jgi:hypothetical protein
MCFSRSCVSRHPVPVCPEANDGILLGVAAHDQNQLFGRVLNCKFSGRSFLLSLRPSEFSRFRSQILSFTGTKSSLGSLNYMCVIARKLAWLEKRARRCITVLETGRSMLMKRPLGIFGAPLVSTMTPVGAFACSPLWPLNRVHPRRQRGLAR